MGITGSMKREEGRGRMRRTHCGKEEIKGGKRRINRSLDA